LFGQTTGFDGHTTLTDANAWGVGGFLGLFVAPNLALEAGAARSGTEDVSSPAADANWTPIRGRLVYGIPASDRIYPLLGVGLVRNNYSDAVDGSDTGITGLLGLKGYVSDRVALRTDLSLDHMWSPFNEGDTFQSDVVSSHTNWTLTAGLSIDLGRGRARDTDGDGVRDRDDRCAGTPMGVGVQLGCRVDTDGDGVFDEDDRCADTPSGVRVDSGGCRIDTDGDGVFDEDDRCADTPDGVRVNADGCRVDTDGDGVFDEEDRCANSPSGSEVDANGCPVLFEADETTLVLEGVTFETSSAELTSASQSILNRVAESLVGNPEIRVRVTGHTDSTGSRAFNLTLSQSRAESVARYLAGRGGSESRMEAQGFGPDRPVASNDDEAGRQMNRRVELERIN
jgi:OOP family OmpA-OmpF porin